MKKEDIKVTWFVILIMIQIITVICVLRGLELKCNQDNIISHKEGFPMYVHGLAIDSEENTYIGVVGKINVYNKYPNIPKTAKVNSTFDGISNTISNNPFQAVAFTL